MNEISVTCSIETTHKLTPHIVPGLVCDTSTKFQNNCKNRKQRLEDQTDTHGERQRNDDVCHRQHLSGVNIENLKLIRMTNQIYRGNTKILLRLLEDQEEKSK